MNGGTGPSFLTVTFYPDGLGGTGIGCGTVFSFIGSETLPPVAGGHHCLDMDWMISPTADPGLTTLDFCDCLGSPPLVSTVVIGGASLTPLFVPAAGVIVDVGGTMSHAVIVSRELGIPCVVSATGATTRIPDGAQVKVNGDTGTVTILDT